VTCERLTCTGVGVFAGYHGRADLTSEVLITVNGDECYATGDFARWDMKAGQLVFIGRRDSQVKLRGQRIELATIEAVIIGTSSKILNCVVAKEEVSGQSYLAGYIKTRDENENNNLKEDMIKMCNARLPSYMVPSKWVFVNDFPLNANGKIDRQKLSQLRGRVVLEESMRIITILSPLERKLADIFCRSFQLDEMLDIETPFGQLGGTSLGVMHALILIRQELCGKLDIGLLFANPSVRQLAVALEHLFTSDESLSDRQEPEEGFSVRPRASWFLETLGIMLLACQWLWPIYAASRLRCCGLEILLVPFMHLLQYPMFVKLFGGPFPRGRGSLYSKRYYHLWFLRHQWSLNRYWLGQLLGTPIYNAYLVLCGARIGFRTHIYTSQIDAPWLLEVGNGSYIGEEVVLSSLTYHDSIYDLHTIHVGSRCSIGTRCVLYDRVDMHDGVFVEPLTAVTGRVVGDTKATTLPHQYSHAQFTFQFVTVPAMMIMNALIFNWSWSMVSWMPLYLSLPFCWLIWSLLGAGAGLVLLRYVAGNVPESFTHSLNSLPFLRHFWLRHLILRSFGPCLSNIFDGLYSITPSILRCLGVTIETGNIQIADFVPLLAVPPNLLTLKRDVTITSEICFIPYDVTIEGQCVIAGAIEINRRSFLGNNCMIRSGVSVPEGALIGSLTRMDLATATTKKS
jgi:acetyltransferase-like isoleucine patch superfamily enzyme